MAWWVKRQNIAGLCQQTFQFSSADSFSWSCFPSCWIGAKIQISSKIAVWQSDSMKQNYRGFTFTSDNENPTNFHLYKTNNFLFHAKTSDVQYFLQFLDVQISNSILEFLLAPLCKATKGTLLQSASFPSILKQAAVYYRRHR